MAAVEHHGAFGQDAFGRWAEKTARSLGTPRYIVGQTFVVALMGGPQLDCGDPALGSIPIHPSEPRVLAPGGRVRARLILLAQTRQADRDKVAADATEAHREREERMGREGVTAIKTETDRLAGLLESNTTLTQQDNDLTDEVAKLAREMHSLLVKQA